MVDLSARKFFNAHLFEPFTLPNGTVTEISGSASLLAISYCIPDPDISVTVKDTTPLFLARAETEQVPSESVVQLLTPEIPDHVNIL